MSVGVSDLPHLLHKVQSQGTDMTVAASVAPKPSALSEAEQDALEVTAVTEAVPEWVEELAQPLNDLLAAGPRATVAKESYNRSLLGLILRGLRRVAIVPNIMNDIYDRMVEAVPSQVGAIASEDVSEEAAAERRTSAVKRIHDAGGPFWRICAIIAIDGKAGVTSLLEQAEGDKATLGRLYTWTNERIDTLAFDASRGATPCHYTLRSGVEVKFTVAEATATWLEYTDARAVVKAMNDDNSQEWGAVRRQYRVENPAGMPDGRSKKEQSSDEVRKNRAIVLAMTDDEKATVTARLLTDEVT